MENLNSLLKAAKRKNRKEEKKRIEFSIGGAKALSKPHNQYFESALHRLTKLEGLYAGAICLGNYSKHG